MGINLDNVDYVTSGECINCLNCTKICPKNNAHLALNKKAVNEYAAVAVAVAGIGVFVATRPGVLDPTLVPRTTVTAMTMDPVGDSEFAASFTMTRHDWGTNIDMTCTYSEGDRSASDAGSDADRLAMVAIGRDGSHVQLGTWKARSGETAQTSGSTSMPIDEIAAVQVVAADTGDVLLQRNL